MSTIKSSDEHLTLNADGSAKSIKFQANGVEKASIDSSGNLTVSGNLTSVGIDDNADATAITIDSSENVGIGTATPLDVCHIQGASTKGNVVIGQVTTTEEPYIDLWRNDTSIGSTNLLGRISFSGSDNTAATRTAHAKIEGQANGTHSAGDNPSQLKFYTTPVGSETMAERLAITNDGRGLSEFTAKAWCKFAAQNSSNLTYGHNVSSVSYVATGHYRINYTNSLTYNYSAQITVSDNGGRMTTFMPGEFEQAYCGIFITNTSQSGTTAAIACFMAFGE